MNESDNTSAERPTPTKNTPLQSADAKTQPKKPAVKKSRSLRSRVISSLIVLALCFGAGYAGVKLADRTDIGTGKTAEYQKVEKDGNLSVTPTEQNISSVVEKVSPSVVSIVTTAQTSGGGTTAVAAGTGMIVSKDGYIMTNKHVVNNASKATIITSDGKTFKNVPVLGADPLNDIAFLKIADVNDLTPISLGDSKTIRVGQSVVAIGNALGQYQNTVTSGIVSGLGRPVTASENGQLSSDAENLTDLIQTDAAINSGNSGGPLLNLKGQVIGINTAVAADAQSIGFAIPIGAAKGMIAHVIKTGDVKRAVIGLRYQTVTPELKDEKNLPVDHGDYVQAVSGSGIQADSPAAKAGLKAGDIILKVNGEDVGPGKSISTLIGEFQPGDTVTLTVLRDGKTIQKQLTLTSY